MKQYPDIVYEFRTSRGYFWFYLTSSLLLLGSVIGYYTGYLHLYSEQFTDNQTIIFIWFLMPLTMFFSIKSFFRWEGVIITKTHIVLITYKDRFWKISPNFYYDEYKFENIKSLTLAKLDYFSQHSVEYANPTLVNFINKAKIRTIVPQLVGGGWLVVRHIPCFYIAGQTNSSWMIFRTASEAEILKLINSLKSLRLSIIVPENTFKFTFF